MYPATLEEIFRRLTFIEDCMVMGIPDAELGQAIHLDVVLGPGPEEDFSEKIFRFAAENLPRSRRPRSVLVVGSFAG